MLTNQELQDLIANPETFNVEKTISGSDFDKFGEAICSFANDFPNSQKNGYLLIGVDDKKGLVGLEKVLYKNKPLTDPANYDLFCQQVADLKNNFSPFHTSFSIQEYELDNKKLLVVEVSPSKMPPVRYKNNVYIRPTAQKAKATEADERILSEKRVSYAKTFDLQPCLGADQAEELVHNTIKENYLPSVIDADTLERNHRDYNTQLASLRLYDPKNQVYTNAGILSFGSNVRFHIPSAYIQYIKYSGLEIDSEQVTTEKELSFNLYDLFKEVTNFINTNIIKTKPIRGEDGFKDSEIVNYPYAALRETMMNALIHRDYDANSYIRFTEFINRIEISNPGGLHPEIPKNDFGLHSAYRNPIIADIAKQLGYVNKFGAGIGTIKSSLKKNGNPPAEFNFSSFFSVTLHIHPQWQPQE